LLSSLDDQARSYKIEYDIEPFGPNLKIIQEQINKHDLLVLFNAKRDLHWLRRYGINFSHRRIWDVQLAHFIITGQEEPYPSLNGVANYYNLGQKDDLVENEYWSKRIDTNEIPLAILIPYLYLDLQLTRDCYVKQLEGISARQLTLLNLCCYDLLILEEIEWNGLDYDLEKSKEEAEQIRAEISGIDNVLSSLVGFSDINWNSGDHCSAVLYGGSIPWITRVVDGVYQSGKKEGQPKYRIQKSERQFVRRVDPLENTALDKEGFYSTAEGVLRSLKANGETKRIIDLLLERAKLDKLVSSYFEGLPKQLQTMGWERRIHGTLNQCVAATGRLSSSKPNLQNNPKKVDKLFVSRYAKEE
jgi:DNA polymerase I-like protein with 3'-5' exonuclease and polymerase domains